MPKQKTNSGAIKEEQIKAEYVVSPFTNYVLYPTNGNVIYDDTFKASGFLGYDVSSDFTYNQATKTVELGDPKIAGGITISNSIVFGHASNSSLNYTESQFSDGALFANDGTVVTSDTRLYPNSKYPTNRLYTIKLTSDVNITNNAYISIGALIGTVASTGSSGGVINGDFVCLDLNGHKLTINSGCTLNAYGYIIDSKLDKDGKHTGSIVNNGTIYTGFVVEDYNGGGATVGRGFSSQMPFSLYSLPYLACKVVNNYGGNIKVPTMLYANSIMNKTVLNWFGSDSNYFLHAISDTSVLTIDTYNNLSADGKSYAENFRTFYNFNGNFKTNNLKLEIKFESSGISVNAIIDMAQFAFYIPPYADIILEGNGSTFDLNMLLQFLPGSSLKISENSRLSLTSTDFNTYVAPFNVSGISKSIKEGTSNGGIIERTEMPPSSTTSFAYTRSDENVTNFLYNFNYDYYKKYEIEEKELLKSGDARIDIYGSVNVSNDGSHILSGFMEMGDKTIGDINNNFSNINAFPHLAETFGNVNGASPLANWYNPLDGTWPTKISYGGYINQPLVIANANKQSDTSLVGRVFNPSKTVSGNLSSEVYYNYRKGYFYDILSKKYYIFDMDDSVGSVASDLNEIQVRGIIKEAEGIDEQGVVSFDGNKHIYFRNAFLETGYPSQNMQLNGSGLYIFDTIANSYNKITSGTVNYTYEAERYSKEFKAANSVGQYSIKARTSASQEGFKTWFGTDWNGDVVRGNWENLPLVDTYYEIEGTTISLGTQIKSSLVNVSNVKKIDTVKTDIDLSRTLISGGHLSQNNLQYNDYSPISNASCTLAVNSDNSIIEYDEWSFYGEYLSEDQTNNNGNNADGWTVTDNSILGTGNMLRERYEYYDYYWFKTTGVSVNSDFSIDNVTLYQRGFSSGIAIKFDSESQIWIRA